MAGANQLLNKTGMTVPETSILTEETFLMVWWLFELLC